jgi:hypothetical protein
MRRRRTALRGAARRPHSTADARTAALRSKPHLESMFRSVTLVAHIHNPYGVSNDEWGAEVWVCRGQRRPWPALWPQFKNYG